MNCDRATQLHAYHDAELTSSARAEFERHLESCPACRDMLVGLRRVSRLIDEAQLAPLPEGLIENVIARRRAESTRSVLRITGCMTTAAAMVMVFTLVRGSATVTPTDSAPVSTATWETAALVPPIESRAEPNSEIALLTLWMTDGLTDRGGR